HQSAGHQSTGAQPADHQPAGQPTGQPAGQSTGQSTGAAGTQPTGGAAPARWTILMPKKSSSAGAQSSGSATQEQKTEQKPKQKPEQKQDSNPVPAPAVPGKQSPLQQVRVQLSDEGDDGRVRIGTDLVSLPVTVTDVYNRLVTGLDKRHFEIYEDKVKQEISFFSDDD